MNSEVIFAVSDFVAVFNQTIEYAYPRVTIQGELANFRISKNRWVYFDLKDELSSVKFFGSVYNLPGPLEEGMILKVTGSPQLHPQYGFSVTVHSIQLSGEGSIKKGAELLKLKLEKEGLFNDDRKRILPYPPESIGLITSGESAAYGDFIKVLKHRWGGIDIKHYDVNVQGEDAPNQIVKAIEYFNSHSSPVQVLVITRGGGSADDLQAFSTESVARAVAGSRIPTLIAIGHEVDLSLAELVADKRASTPSNAAELLVPDKKDFIQKVRDVEKIIYNLCIQDVNERRNSLVNTVTTLNKIIDEQFAKTKNYLSANKQLIELLNPNTALKRGYALVTSKGQYVDTDTVLTSGDEINVLLYKRKLVAIINSIERGVKQ